ncbi:MAG: carboxypeptidase-like regulatory domain-containing protein [Bacteroidota bacterium]
MKKILSLLFLLCSLSVFSQTERNNDLVQFSGVVVAGDSLEPIPFTSIMVRNSYHGTVSDVYGFFSFVARMKDTIEFSAIGFRHAVFIVPDTITDFRCSLIQILKTDTIRLPEVTIFPWPTLEQFKEAFVNLKVPNDDLTRAQRNLNKNELNYLATTMAMDGSMNFRNSMATQQSRLYYAGQVPTSNWLNPIAWARFVQAWQNGDFKKKNTEKPKREE